MNAALLVIDVQNALCNGQWAAYDVDNVVQRINTLSGMARVAGVPVIFVQHEEEHETMRFDSQGWQLYEKLDVQPQDLRVRKKACDSFFKTNLRELLTASGVGKIIVTGMQSEFCVDSTVRGALANGFEVVLVSDGHTTLDNGVLSAAQITAHHNVTLQNIGNFGPPIKVVPTSEVRVAA